MKEHYQRKVEETAKKGTVDTSVVENYEKQKGAWDQERQFLQEQVSFMQKQVQENKAMHEALLNAINQRGINRDKDDQ